MASHVQIDFSSLKPGDKFDTPFESGCEFIRWDDDTYMASKGNFIALDSERVECQFNIVMVEWVHRTA